MNSMHPDIHIAFVHFYILVGPDADWVCTITSVRDGGTDMQNGGSSYVVVVSQNKYHEYRVNQ